MTKSINLDDEFTKLFTKEEVAAFCEVTLSQPNGVDLTGLCKVSKPRPGSSSLNYVGVLFVFDTPTNESWKHISAALQGLEGAALKQCLTDLDYATSSPVSTPSPEVFIKQIEKKKKKGFALSNDYILEQLHPALSAVTKIPLGEMMLWEDPAAASTERVLTKADAAAPSLFGAIRDLILGRNK